MKIKAFKREKRDARGLIVTRPHRYNHKSLFSFKALKKNNSIHISLERARLAMNRKLIPCTLCSYHPRILISYKNAHFLFNCLCIVVVSLGPRTLSLFFEGYLLGARNGKDYGFISGLVQTEHWKKN